MITKKTLPYSETQALRQEALTVLFAQYVSKTNDHVIHFRDKVLGDKFPLQIEEVERWIKSQLKKDMKETGGKEKAEGGKILSYNGPLLKAVKGGALNKLQSISEYLAETYHWSETHATYFVLTDIAPLVHLYDVEHVFHHTIFSASRINLTLDPALTDKEVAAIYRKARQEMLKKDKQGKARFRLQSEKHLRLAIFEAEQPDELTYRVKMRHWNKQFPKWKYKHESNFIRDTKKAIQRLLQPDYFDWEGMFNG